MKKVAIAALVLVMTSSITITGCKETTENNKNNPSSKIQSSAAGESKNTLQKTVSTEATSETSLEKSKNQVNLNAYRGDWKLKVYEDEKLYLLTSLEDYFGRTAIEIESAGNNTIKGTITSIQGAPSYRQASVDFKGEVKNNKMTAAYKDDNWLYSGKIELSFRRDEISAIITRDKTKEPPMWGIPEGNLSFVRPIETKTVTLTKKEKGELERVLAPDSTAKTPVIQEMLEDAAGNGTYYAIVDYFSDNPQDGKKLEYERFLELQKTDAGEYVIKSINEIKYPIDFEALKELRKQQ